MDLNDTLGCTFVGVALALFFYGLSCAQTAFYFREYPKDVWYLKVLVSSLWLLDTARTLVDGEFLYEWLVTSHAGMIGLTVIPNAFIAEFFFAALTVFIVQCYYVNIIWRLLRGRWVLQMPLAVSALILSMFSFVGGIVTIRRAIVNRAFSVAIPAIIIPASIQTVTAFVTDVYITASLCIILYSQKPGFKRTANLIQKLVVYSINRGIFTALFQAGHFVTYIITRGDNDLYWMLTHLPATSVYVNSLVALLNARNSLRETAIASEGTELRLPMEDLISRSGDMRLRSRSRGKRPSRPRVSINPQEA